MPAQKPSAAEPRLRASRGTYGAGTYIACAACGRLLKIEWAVRSLVCSCGARVHVEPTDGK
jgi:DNA-directed RNA polymerase subunit RPC12/RpoP